MAGAPRDPDIAKDEDLTIKAGVSRIPVAPTSVGWNAKKILDALARVGAADLKVHRDPAASEIRSIETSLTLRRALRGPERHVRRVAAQSSIMAFVGIVDDPDRLLTDGVMGIKLRN